MDPFTPDVRAAMLAPPVNPIRRTDFVHKATPTVHINCNLYHMVPVHPGPAPTAIPPPGPGRGSDTRLDEQKSFNKQTVARAAALKRWTVANPGGNPAKEPAMADPDMIFTHGRGSTLVNEAIVSFTEGWARTQVALNFENTGDLNTRAAVFRALMLAFPSATSLGGRSLGARAATRGSIYSRVSKLVMFTYPLVRGLDERFEELLALQSNVDWVRMINGDHALWYDPPEKRDALCNIAGQIAAMWNVARDPLLTELTLDWDDVANQPSWTAWMAPPADPPREVTIINVNILNPGLPGGGGNFSFNMEG
ncbi:hypothetical protein IFR05_004868 [Cadophora sp. M221]|nr:hypothetical protein IFR05_004868 [Cadophora sp. M221]